MTETSKIYEKYRKDNKLEVDSSDMKRLNRPFTYWGKILLAISSILYILAIWHFTPRSNAWHALGGIMFTYLLYKLVCAIIYRPYTNELTKPYDVSVIITCYNEDPHAVVNVLDNIRSLDYPVKEIIFLDDGSADTTAYEIAKAYADDYGKEPGAPKYNIIRFTENRGKRAVMVDGFKACTSDYVFMLDSDSEIMPNALTELLRPFEKKKTTSVVGHVGVLNRVNFITKMQSVTYYNAFQLGRAAQSVSGNVIVCSGAFSLHKMSFIRENWDTFEATKIFGITCSSGDDRTLTSFSRISGGRVRYQSTAYCATIVPSTWRKLLAQRRRWQRSSYLGSLASIRAMFPRRPGFMLWTFAEAYFWLVALILFVISVITRGYIYFDWRDFLIFTAIVNLKHNGFYFLYRPLHFFVVPIYSLVYGIFLVFTRFHALVTITNDGWGTRDAKRDESAAPGTQNVSEHATARG